MVCALDYEAGDPGSMDYRFVIQCWRGGGGNSLYMTWYGCAARIAPFFSAARFTISPLFPKKPYMTDPFFLDWYMNGPSLNVHIFALIFSSETQIETKLYYFCVNFEYR